MTMTIYCGHDRHDDCDGKVGISGGDSRPPCTCTCHEGSHPVTDTIVITTRGEEAANSLLAWAQANPESPLCISVGTKKEVAAFLWALAAYAIPATVRVDATNPKVFHLSVPARFINAPVLWLATLREDAQACSAPANGYKHQTVEESR